MRILLQFFLVSIVGMILAFYLGKETERQEALEAANAAFQKSREVENEVEALTPYNRGFALGGVSDQCKVFLRGLDITTESK